MLQFLSDLLFPKRCVGCKKHGSYLCIDCFSHIELFQEYVCPMCLKRSITGETHPSCKTPLGIDGLMCGVVYKGVVKRLLFRFKYPPYISDLGNTVGSLFRETISQNDQFFYALPQQPIVIVVPLSSQKLKKRGYNHAEVLGNFLAQEFKLQKNYKILERIKHTKPQFQLNKLQRLKNVKDAFYIEPRYRNIVKGRTIFLVDDLATSCATLKECAKILKRNGAKRVYGVTFAREL